MRNDGTSKRHGSQSLATAAPRPKAVLLGVQLPGASDAEMESSLSELARLARTLGLEVVARVTQRRTRLASAAVVGAGKLKELARYTGGSGVVPVGPPGARRRGRDAGDDAAEPAPEDAFELGEAGAAEAPRGAAETATAETPRDAGEADAAEAARDGGEAGAAGVPRDGGQAGAAEAASEAVPRASVVLVNHDLSPSQARNLERATGAEVLDRSAVILAIFQRHARSREARLQVEIARLSYMAPRLRETGGGRDRQGGGIGGRGAGESASELDRRKVRDRIAELRAELAAIEREAGTRRSRRSELRTVALVGYTNAGKSSWMRALTGSGVLVEDKLFATLDTTVRALQPETTPRILVSDTVGFIQQLPHDLVASFRSTLDEARECDLLVHVVDASDPAFPSQVAVTREVLASIGASDDARLMVLNKADRLDAGARERLAPAWPEALLLSVRDPADVARLRERIVSFFEGELVEAELVVPYARQRVVADAHAAAQVLSETHDAHGTHLRLRAGAGTLARLRAALENAS